MANLCIKAPSSASLVLIFQLLVLRPRPITTFSKRKQGANFVIAQPDCADRSNPLEDVTIVTLPGRRRRNTSTFKEQILSYVKDIFLLRNKYCLAFI